MFWFLYFSNTILKWHNILVKQLHLKLFGVDCLMINVLCRFYTSCSNSYRSDIFLIKAALFYWSDIYILLYDRLKDEIYTCVLDHTLGCNSIETAPLQFFIEWLLSDCSFNQSVSTMDSYSGIAQCKLQFAYNLNIGFHKNQGESFVVLKCSVYIFVIC